MCQKSQKNNLSIIYQKFMKIKIKLFDENFLIKNQLNQIIF